MVKRTILLVLFSLLYVGCSTKRPADRKVTDRGVWAGKVQMTNKTTQNRKWVYVTWASDSETDRMRVDVSAVFDVPVATYLKNEEGSHLWLFNEQKYYFSEDSGKLFKQLTKVSVDPDIFYSLLGQPKSPGEDWSCTDQQAELNCQSTTKKTHFSVQYGEADRRLIKIFNGLKALQIKLSRTKVQLRNQLFEKLSTSRFKTYRL